MGFLRDQRTKWRARHHSSCDSDATPNATPVSSSAPPTPSLAPEPIAFPYGGGPLGLTLQRSKSPWVDDIGPAKLTWHKDRRLGITFHEKPARAGGVDPAIAIKELADDARSHPAVCVGMELIGVNGEPVAGVPLATVMDIIRSSKSPCELAFTPPPSPILVAEVLSAAATARGITTGYVLVAVDDAPMLGCSLQDASDAIGAATPDAPVTLRLAPLHVVFQGRESDGDAAPRSNESAKRSLRNTLCITAVAAALTV